MCEKQNFAQSSLIRDKHQNNGESYGFVSTPHNRTETFKYYDTKHNNKCTEKYTTKKKEVNNMKVNNTNKKETINNIVKDTQKMEGKTYLTVKIEKGEYKEWYTTLPDNSFGTRVENDFKTKEEAENFNQQLFNETRGKVLPRILGDLPLEEEKDLFIKLKEGE